MKALQRSTLMLIAALLTTLFFSCDKDDTPEKTLTPSEILASTPWETTGAKDNTGQNVAGAVLFTRVVDIIVLTRNEFTYRIYPNASDRSIYYDIIHTPTTHKEP